MKAVLASGSVALLAQPWLTAHLGATRSGPLTWPLVGLVSVYGGYFGAGSGIMLLALLLVLVDDRLPEANAVKNMLLGVDGSPGRRSDWCRSTRGTSGPARGSCC